MKFASFQTKVLSNLKWKLQFSENQSNSEYNPQHVSNTILALHKRIEELEVREIDSEYFASEIKIEVDVIDSKLYQVVVKY